MCGWWEGLVLRWGRPLGVQQVAVEELYFLPNSSHFFSVFVEDVFTHKLWGLGTTTPVTTVTKVSTQPDLGPADHPP